MLAPAFAAKALKRRLTDIVRRTGQDALKRLLCKQSWLLVREWLLDDDADGVKPIFDLWHATHVAKPAGKTVRDLAMDLLETMRQGLSGRIRDELLKHLSGLHNKHRPTKRLETMRDGMYEDLMRLVPILLSQICGAVIEQFLDGFCKNLAVELKPPDRPGNPPRISLIYGLRGFARHIARVDNLKELAQQLESILSALDQVSRLTTRSAHSVPGLIAGKPPPGLGN